MYMGQFRFKCWCDDAVSGILFPPDQKKVSEELYHHLKDHYDALIEQGLDKEEAVRATLRSMGDPHALAKDLAAVHRPFWGYFLRLTRILLVIALVVTLIPFGKFLYTEPYREPTVWGFDVFDPDVYEEKGHTLLRYTTPNCTARSDGYSFTVTDVTQWQYCYTSNGTPGTTDVLSLRMTEWNPIPWAEHTEVAQWFWAEDSLGNIYDSTNEHDPYSDAEYLCASGGQSNPFRYTYTLWINNFDNENIQWLTIHYDRDGRDLTWHIDLTGGAAS